MESIRPAARKGVPLKRLGATNAWTMINAKVAMTGEERKRVDEEILKLKIRKHKDVKVAMEGQREIEEAKVSLRHKYAWSKNIKKVSTAEIATAELYQPEEKEKVEKYKTVLFACPKMWESFRCEEEILLCGELGKCCQV